MLDRRNGEVCAELYPTELFVLLPLFGNIEGRRLFVEIVTQAMKIRHKQFRTAEKVIAWKLAHGRAAVNLASENAATFLNHFKNQGRRKYERIIKHNRTRAERALKMLADARRNLQEAETSLVALAPLVSATEEEAAQLIKELQQLRSVEEVAFKGEELRVTTDTIYSTLVVVNPRRVFCIGKIEIRLNVVTRSIRFRNITSPRMNRAAPHIGQGDSGCLDRSIELDVKTHLANGEWVSAIQVCLRLLTASQHPNESELWPEVDPKTRMVLSTPTKE